jgi:putative flippase GtrA
MNAPGGVSGSFSLASREVDISRLLSGTSLGALFSRYTASSVVALATSEVALVLLFGTGLLGAGPAAVIAFLSGAIPNYVLNRSWVWKRRGNPRVGREFVPYVLVSLATLLLAALATTVAARIAPGGETAQTVFVAIAYLVANGVLFVAKFVIYHLFLFGDGAPDRVGHIPAVRTMMRSRDLSETEAT